MRRIPYHTLYCYHTYYRPCSVANINGNDMPNVDSRVRELHKIDLRPALCILTYYIIRGPIERFAIFEIEFH